MNAIAPETPALDLAALNEEFAQLTLKERFALIGERFGERAIASTSAGAQASVMLHLVTKHLPQLPIVFIDTGYHFRETYHYLETLKERFGADFRVYTSKITPARQEALWGQRWEGDAKDLEQYGLLNKVEPMNRALRELGATTWLSGVRRAHSSGRAQRNFFEQQKGTLKIFPILDWSEDDMANYMTLYSLPAHPLVEKGYVSIGDWHSTKPLEEGMHAEDTRFNGIKRECGLHEASDVSNFQI
ncbi:MAG: phosphoadenylyl-sulfate reductase [Verrucomicrobiota bacterium]